MPFINGLQFSLDGHAISRVLGYLGFTIIYNDVVGTRNDVSCCVPYLNDDDAFLVVFRTNQSNTAYGYCIIKVDLKQHKQQ